jgi:hypothetical protein
MRTMLQPVDHEDQLGGLNEEGAVAQRELVFCSFTMARISWQLMPSGGSSSRRTRQRTKPYLVYSGYMIYTAGVHHIALLPDRW